MKHPSQTDGSESVGYCDGCGEWSDNLEVVGGRCGAGMVSCPQCDGRDKEIVEILGTLERTAMTCKCCGQFSSSQYCWYCTERLAGRDPVILENIRLRKELEELKNRIPDLNI